MNTYGIRSDFRTGQFVPQVSGKDVSPTSFDENRALEIARQIAEDIDAGRAPADPSEQEQTLALLRKEMGECVDGLSIREAVALLVSQRENARNACAAFQEQRDKLEEALKRISVMAEADVPNANIDGHLSYMRKLADDAVSLK